MILTREGDDLHLEIDGALWRVPDHVYAEIVRPHLPDFILVGTAISGTQGWRFHAVSMPSFCGKSPPALVRYARPPRRRGLEDFLLFCVPFITTLPAEGEPYCPTEAWTPPLIRPLDEVAEL